MTYTLVTKIPLNILQEDTIKQSNKDIKIVI